MSDPKKKVYILPSESEIMRRLQSVGCEYEDLFPLIAGHAGEQWEASRMCREFFMAIHALNREQILPVTKMFMTMVPRWIDALVDDIEVAAAAKEILKSPRFAPRA